MPQRLRLEVNGQQVRNPLVRTLVGTLITILIAAALLVLGVILLPIFVAVLAVAAVAGGIGIYRFRRFLRQVQNRNPRNPGERTDHAPPGLDPSKEVHVGPARRDPGE